MGSVLLVNREKYRAKIAPKIFMCPGFSIRRIEWGFRPFLASTFDALGTSFSHGYPKGPTIEKINLAIGFCTVLKASAFSDCMRQLRSALFSAFALWSERDLSFRVP